MAAILAKRSERFPGKHMFRIHGTTVIGMIADTLIETRAFSDVVIYTKDPEVTAPGVAVIADSTSGTALDSIGSLLELYEVLFVVAGDMPLISTDIVRGMVARYGGKPMFPVHADGEIEPLHGIYNSSMKAALREYLNSGKKSLKGFIESCDYETVPIEPPYENSFFNLNCKEDIEKLEQLTK